MHSEAVGSVLVNANAILAQASSSKSEELRMTTLPREPLG